MFRPIRLALTQLLAFGLAGPALAQAPAEKAPPKSGTATKAKSAKLRVSVPDEEAELTLMGKATKQTGLKREFDIPELAPEQKYVYELIAKWRPNNYTVITRKKTVQFEAGADLVVDLTVDDPADRAEIRYVPTPEDVVARMVQLAAIKPDDVVFEPGCGDGRIVTAAVKAGAKRGVGVDLDPERVTESKATVEQAQLGEKIEIRQGDALDIKDFSDATVVFLYMGNEFNALIRPILWKSLKPGTRIVSHRFTMGDWKPDRTVTMTGADMDEYEIHLWTVTEEIKARAKSGDKPTEKAKESQEKFVNLLSEEAEDALARLKKAAAARKKKNDAEEKARATNKKAAAKKAAAEKKKQDDKKKEEDPKKKRGTPSVASLAVPPV